MGYFSVPDYTRTSESLRCSFDQGTTWVKPERIIASVYDSTNSWGASFAPYKVAIPEGATQIQFTGEDNTWQNWMAADFNIFASFGSIGQVVWDGGGTTPLWSDPMNWDADELPSGTDQVIIPSGHTVELNVDAQVYELSIEQDVHFEILPGTEIRTGGQF